MRPWGRRASEAAVASRLVWILGSPRTGSTWLLNLMRVGEGVAVVDEPLVGAHLGLSAAASLGITAAAPTRRADWRTLDAHRGREDYFFSDRYRGAWAPALRSLLLARLGAQLGTATRLVVKEPHGSEAADLLGQLLPESRFLVLVRDGRDVVDSMRDALTAGSWASGVATLVGDDRAREAFLVDASHAWVQRVSSARSALAAAGERGLLLRYEDLLADPVRELERVLGWAGLGRPHGLEEHVEALRFDRVAAADRGSGRFHRAAEPGLWRTNLTSGEVGAVEAIMGPTLEALGYEAGGS